MVRKSICENPNSDFIKNLKAETKFSPQNWKKTPNFSRGGFTMDEE